MRLSGGSRRNATAAALVAATKFTSGEVVETVVAGRYLANDAVVILTNRRLLIANDREWDAEIVSISDLANLGVEGWVERRAATLRLTDGAVAHVIDRINDTSVAETLTTALRAR